MRRFLMALVVAGCGFQPQYGDGQLECGPGGACPDELVCASDNRCRVSALGSLPDAGDDAPPPMQPLDVTVEGEGAVSSDPAAIDCGATCEAMLPRQSLVTLAASPDSTSVFEGWSGDCSGRAACALTMDGPRSAHARFARHGAKRWVSQVSFAKDDFLGGDLATDAQGNVIAAGVVDDTGDQPNLYVVKYAVDDGRILWEKLVDTPNFSEVQGGLAVDAAGNVYVGMRFSGFGTTTIGGTMVTADLFGNIVVLRLAAATGAIEWVKQWGGDGQDKPTAIAVSGNDLYVAGTTSSSPSSFDGKTLAGDVDDGFLVRASATNGFVAEAKLIPGTFGINGLAVNDGRVAVAGDFRGTMTLDGCSIASSGTGFDGMVLDFLGSTLVCQWSQDFGDSANDMAAFADGIAAVPGGGWVVTGGFQGAVLFAESGTALGSRGSFDAFLVRYDREGVHQYSLRYGDTGVDFGRQVAVTPEGNVLFAGEFESKIQLGLFGLTGVNELFVTRLTPGLAPLHEWAVVVGGDASSERCEGLALAADGSVNLLGGFKGQTIVAGTPLTSREFDAFIVSLVR